MSVTMTIRYSIPAVFVSDTEEAARRLTWWVWYYAREKIKRNKETKIHEE